MKVSFDFDGTLELDFVQKYAEDLINRGVEVWIITSRFSDSELGRKNFLSPLYITNRDLIEVMDRLGIDKNKVIFTNMEDKWKFIKDKGFIWHLDDDPIENKMINSKTFTKGIDFFDNDKWHEECEYILNNTIF
ncbi:MAG TPA: hypothetical protein P5513_07020 [Candidatus Diapherotrites archaeon]|nr:hypothetical protein [Candidatus Diapherotrites archaeon]